MPFSPLTGETFALGSETHGRLMQQDLVDIDGMWTTRGRRVASEENPGRPQSPPPRALSPMPMHHSPPRGTERWIIHTRSDGSIGRIKVCGARYTQLVRDNPEIARQRAYTEDEAKNILREQGRMNY
jgi:hypothetical protein